MKTIITTISRTMILCTLLLPIFMRFAGHQYRTEAQAADFWVKRVFTLFGSSI